MQSNQNRILVGIVVLLVILGSVYYIGQKQVEDAVQTLGLEFSEFDLTRLSIIPPEIDITLTYTVTNPSDLPLEISVNGLLYHGDTVISPVRVDERLIPARGAGEIEVAITLNRTLLEAIGNPENSGSYRLDGRLTATGLYLGALPVSVELNLSEIEAEN